jgi:hypothetical protein
MDRGAFFAASGLSRGSLVVAENTDGDAAAGLLVLV